MILSLSPNLASHFCMFPGLHSSLPAGNGMLGKPAGEKKKDGSRFGDPFLKLNWRMGTS
jgi:hypothetical protein